MSDFWGPFTQTPNLLIFMTDQQRTTQWYPRLWVQENLPNLWMLQQRGVTFTNGMTNTSACSPSRATLWTSTFPMLNGVDSVGQTLNLTDPETGEPVTVSTGPGVDPRPMTTLGLMLQNHAPAGVDYQVAYKGKWHLTESFSQGVGPIAQQGAEHQASQASDNATMASTYGFNGWTSPDFGTSMDAGASSIPTESLATLGGGVGQNDARVAVGTSWAGGSTVASAAAFLRNVETTPERPFCLVVSLLNPHDIFASPDGYASAGYLPPGLPAPWRQAPFTEITSVPPNAVLTPPQLANKPAAQASWRTDYTADQALDYLRFYAYLETLSDALLGQVWAELKSEHVANTLVLRLADHGEMGMSQGYMIEKEAQAYNETLLVPMVFTAPGLPAGAQCGALAGLVDVLPTLAEICGLSDLDTYATQGQSLADAVLAGDKGQTTDQLLFASDDHGLELRCLIDLSLGYKYVVTANGEAWQCELYPFTSDDGVWADEMDNLVPVDGLTDGTPASSQALQTAWNAMHVQLTATLTATNTTPADWPDPPPAVTPARRSSNRLLR